MGSAICKKDEIQIKNLYQLYDGISKQKLSDNIYDELNSINIRIIKDKIRKESQLINNILLNNIQEKSILETQRIKFQQEQYLNNSKIKNDKSQYLFFRSFRFFNFEDLRKYIIFDYYKNNKFISEILNLFNTIDLYCQNVQLFISRINTKYYIFFYSLLWKQYKQNVDILNNIFTFDFTFDDLYSLIPFDFTFQQFMYKIWGNNIQPKMNNHQINDLLNNYTNKELIQYFKDFIEISINQYQLNYLENKGLIYSKGFQDFLDQLLELLNQKFDILFYNNVEAILKYIKENRFLNNLLYEQILIYHIYPQVFKYIETQLSIILKVQFKVTKQYIKEQIIQDKIISNTLSKLLLEEEEVEQEEQNYTNIKNKTNYTSSLKVNYLSNQDQNETQFYNNDNNKWECITDIQHSNFLYMIDLSNQVDETKQIINDRFNKLFKTFNLQNRKQQEFIIQYINIIFDYTHINKKEEISELILQLSLFY